jgi:7-cyano-7-deazaguanine synthase
VKIILTLSGGLDSTVLLHHLLEAGHELRALGVDYGQRHRRELEAAATLAARAGVEFKCLDLSSLRPLLPGSALTSDVAVPAGAYAPETLQVTVVPNRNMVLLSLATAWAVALRYDAVSYAAHAGDHAVYADCRDEFVAACERAAQLGNEHRVSFLRPFVAWHKRDIVARGAALGVPFELTWSCYAGGARHCGRCSTCVERRAAFGAAGVPDPTTYEGA